MIFFIETQKGKTKNNMTNELEKYVNENLSHYQDMVIALTNAIEGKPRPNSKSSYTLFANVGQELSSYIVRIKEGEYLAKRLGFDVVLKEEFTKIYEEKNFGILMENNFSIEKGQLTIEGREFNEFFNYVNDNKDSVNKNKDSKNESNGDSK